MTAGRARVVLAAVIVTGGLLAGLPTAAADASLSMEDAVTIALQRNRDAIAARLEIDGAALDVVAARLYPNPVFQYSAANLVLGQANPEDGKASSVGFLSQPVQSVGIGDVIDVWAKRRARTQAAEAGVTRRRWQTEDALREIAFAVRSAFAEVLREQAARALVHEVADRYAETVRLSRSRFAAGDISEAELRKVELEALKYQNEVVDAESELDLGRAALAVLLALPSGDALPAALGADDTRATLDLGRLTAVALEARPDLKAAAAGRNVAAAALTAAEREALPDLTLGASYTHSAFTVSGDNPNTLGVNLSLPVPLFDRNQANIGRARLDGRRAENDIARVKLGIENDVAQAVRKAERSRKLLAAFEGQDRDKPGPTGGMLSRAESALLVAERSYKAGALSLLELLEAQRTYLDTRGQYLRIVHEFRQATIDIIHATGGPVP